MSTSEELFQRFMDKVDEYMSNEYLCGHQDIPDYDYYMAYAEGVSPKTTARRAIKAAQDW